MKMVLEGKRTDAWRDRRVWYGTAECGLGWVVAAATKRGVCRVAFGEGEGELVGLLVREFAGARLEEGGEGFREGVLAGLLEAVEEPGGEVRMDVDLVGTPFQLAVWDALRGIPAGQVRTYGEVARAVGRPGAARAVGAACGANRVAVLVPCHRVVGAGGSLGGYRWGVWRKRVLLEREGWRG
ncbi:methylated-DNA--[protein]-cysteine S-methyltransferase [Spirochaeta thermophila]|uniref:methylated-DNA--[protein]-cysteine S-methyltransferase n=1 Tax=Winmispira thermophila TaxID=154 RepID=UPI0006913A64|nr:methylated-DNA--[protein]-cysteine S-methyltransferase [Spirochaeta thermophila]